MTMEPDAEDHRRTLLGLLAYQEKDLAAMRADLAETAELSIGRHAVNGILPPDAVDAVMRDLRPMLGYLFGKRRGDESAQLFRVSSEWAEIGAKVAANRQRTGPI